MKKFFFVGATLVALCGAVNAATPKTETKSDAKTSTEVKATTSDNTYYVTGLNASDPSLYDLSTTPNDNCGSGSDEPCQISTSQTLGATVSKSDVDNQNNITIQRRQAEFD